MNHNGRIGVIATDKDYKSFMQSMHKDDEPKFRPIRRVKSIMSIRLTEVIRVGTWYKVPEAVRLYKDALDCIKSKAWDDQENRVWEKE